MPTLTELAETVSGDGGGGGYGTAAFTQAVTTVSGELLVVAVMGLTNGGGVVSGLTISGGSLTYTSRLAVARADSYGTFVSWYTAPVTTGASFSISVDATPSIYQWGIWSGSYANYDTDGTPTGVTGSANASGSANAVTVTLSGSPAAASHVISAMVQDCSGGAVTEGTGWTQRFENTTGIVFHVMDDQTSPDSTVEYTDISAGGTVFSYAIASIEINDGGAVVVRSSRQRRRHGLWVPAARRCTR